MDSTPTWLVGSIIGGIVYLLVCAVCGWSIAIEKGRSEWEGFFYGTLFGPIGILIEACLPTRKGKGGE